MILGFILVLSAYAPPVPEATKDAHERFYEWMRTYDKVWNANWPGTEDHIAFHLTVNRLPLLDCMTDLRIKRTKGTRVRDF